MKLRSLLTAGTVTAIDKLTLFGLLFPDEHESLPVQCCASPGASYDSVSVCMSVTSRSSIKTDERIELVFGMGASFHPSYTVLKGNLGVSKNLWLLPSGNLSQNPDLENFASVYRSSKHVIDFAQERWMPRVW